MMRPEPSILDKLESEQAKIDRALEKLNVMEQELREQTKPIRLSVQLTPGEPSRRIFSHDNRQCRLKAPRFAGTMARIGRKFD
jgi:hypothetical protein